ncbi:DUF2726 domain-containing protein [Acinetobacter sp. SwsAc5]|uniref:DUF2726 domain-containing protein n=1 Tax=Acinetobacter sp. SwsAc5 TaxID=2749438 RepID=UPI0015BE34B0|nr:DUF2726 domain-containing protein [Acinetobacter sp. SwsAc5]NWK51980.1 DUF2726 domain-containing protein [Acinetobacter sp. SwsAc5]
MGIIIGGVLLVVIFLVIVSFLKDDSKGKKSHYKDEITGKRMLSANEINLYEKLKEFLPTYTIFSQVAFSAFMTTKDYGTRNTFNRKFADFVVLDQNYEIICIIELDDNSHRNREKQDKYRDDLCAKAGYQVVRFSSQPNMNQIQEKLGYLVQPALKVVNR